MKKELGDILSHHAYIVEGGTRVLSFLKKIIEKKLGVRTAGNPDFFLMEKDSFGIDDGRSLSEAMAESAFKNDLRVFVISARAFTVESQNAILKLFEEPGEQTKLFIVAPSREAIIPTLRSRCALFQSIIPKDENGVSLEEARLFLESPIAKRFLTVKRLADDISEGKKTKGYAAKLIYGMEILEKEFEAKSGTPMPARIASPILLAEKYQSDRGSSIKMLLEHLAISLPRLKLELKPKESADTMKLKQKVKK